MTRLERAESLTTSPGVHEPALRLQARADDLLDGPLIAVQILDMKEPAPRLVVDLARIEATLAQRTLGLLDVARHHLQALH